MDVDLLNRIAGKLAALHGEEIYNLKLLEKQMAEAEKDVENMLNAIQAGIITASTKQRLTELEETKSQLEQQIIEEKIKKPVLTLEQIMFFLNQFKDTDINDEEQRKRLIAFGTTIMPGAKKGCIWAVLIYSTEHARAFWAEKVEFPYLTHFLYTNFYRVFSAFYPTNLGTNICISDKQRVP